MKHIKTGWITTLIAVLVIACGGIAIKLWPRTVPVEECSPVYKEYAGKPGIEVSFVKDYRINDTTFVDVTIIHASTDSAWTVLSRKFGIVIIPAEYEKIFEKNNPIDFKLVSKNKPAEYEKIFEKNNPIDFKLVSKNNPEVPKEKETDTFDLLVTYRKQQSFYIFHLDNINQFNAIVDNKVHELSAVRKLKNQHLSDTTICLTIKQTTP